MDSGDDLERLMSYMGPIGRHQIRQFILLAMGALNAGIHMLSLLTVAAVPKHRCLLPGEEGDTAPSYNSSLAWSTYNSTQGDWPSCWYPLANGTRESCTDFVFDTTYYTSSRAIEWEMVCGRRWMGATAQGGYMFGLVLGSILLGSPADKYGRKPVLVASTLFQFIFTFSVAFVNNYYVFVILRLLSGLGTAGALSSSFVLIMELLDQKYRTAFGMAFQSFFSVGIGVLALGGFLIKDRQILQITYALHNLLMIGHWWLVDESPRWLWSEGRTEEAVEIVTRASITNYGNEFKTELAAFARKDAVHAAVKTQAKKELAKSDEAGGGLSDLFKWPNLRNRTLNMSLNWFANSLVYYGLSMNTGTMEGNPYLILFLVGIVEIPSYVMAAYCMNKVGRRSLTCSFMILGGIACATAVLLPKNTPFGSALETMIVIIGKFFIAGSFAIIYNYTTEMFPTVVRNTALGITAMCARVSGAVTPFITLLDSLDKTLPSLVFAVVVIVSGFLSLSLPETLGRPLPQSIADGENFGAGESWSLRNLLCVRQEKSKRRQSARDPNMIRVPTVIVDEHHALNDGRDS